MVSVALAGPLRVNDNLQTCPTVYKSGTLVLVTIPAFFCNILWLHLGHGMGPSCDVLIPQRIVLQNATGSENFFLTRNASCASRGAFWKSVSPCHGYHIWYQVWYHIWYHTNGMISYLLFSPKEVSNFTCKCDWNPAKIIFLLDSKRKKCLLSLQGFKPCSTPW